MTSVAHKRTACLPPALAGGLSDNGIVLSRLQPGFSGRPEARRKPARVTELAPNHQLKLVANKALAAKPTELSGVFGMPPQWFCRPLECVDGNG